jgi:UbiD family decarboxylase
LGHDPLFLIVAGTEVPLEVSELNYAGAVCARPEAVIYGELTGLPIPAGSEVALEGWLYPSRSEPEGPFGEWTGYYSQSPAPILTLDPQRLYFRDNPILLGAPPGRPPHDYSYMRSVFKSALIHEGLSRCDLPGLQSVWAHESGGGRLLVAVSIKQRYPGHSRQAAYLTSQLPSAAYMNRFVVVVDSDIDPRNLNDVVWAICTRCDPGIDLEVMRRTWGSRVDPLRSEEGPAYNSRAVIDACRPYERLDSFPAVCESTDQTVAAVVDKWPDLLR